MARHWLTAEAARALLESIDRGAPDAHASFDLGLTQERAVLSRDLVRLEDGSEITADELRAAEAARRTVFVIGSDDGMPDAGIADSGIPETGYRKTGDRKTEGREENVEHRTSNIERRTKEPFLNRQDAKNAKNQSHDIQQSTVNVQLPTEDRQVMERSPSTKHESRNRELGTRNTEPETRNPERGDRNWEGAGAARLVPVQIAGELFYKLVPTDEAPTIEISGIQMHRTTGTGPFENAMASARTVVRRGTRVLDTCGGLGYTAIAAARLGAAAVVSCEADPNVRAIARQNPWSSEYFSHPAISRVDGDAFEFVRSQPAGSFDRVIHDPPRFSRAGELYGAEFYGELARVLRRRGQLFHYTGAPYSLGRGRAFVLGIVRRLQGAGFSVRRVDALQGLVAKRG